MIPPLKRRKAAARFHTIADNLTDPKDVDVVRQYAEEIARDEELPEIRHARALAKR
jgi:hypothetical protein